MLAALRSEHATKDFNLPPTRPAIQRNKTIRRTKIPIVLWYFVFEDQMIAEGVPREVAEQPMILMQIVAAVGKNQIR